MFKMKAVQLAEKLIPAFNTPTGIPWAMVNLKTSVTHLHSNPPPHDVEKTQRMNHSYIAQRAQHKKDCVSCLGRNVPTFLLITFSFEMRPLFFVYRPLSS